jgi:hypothetical protein
MYQQLQERRERGASTPTGSSDLIGAGRITWTSGSRPFPGPGPSSQTPARLCRGRDGDGIDTSRSATPATLPPARVRSPWWKHVDALRTGTVGDNLTTQPSVWAPRTDTSTRLARGSTAAAYWDPGDGCNGGCVAARRTRLAGHHPPQRNGWGRVNSARRPRGVCGSGVCWPLPAAPTSVPGFH